VQQSSRDMSSISVSVRPMVQKSFRVTGTAREPRPSAWPDVGEVSEGLLPQQYPLVSEGRPDLKMGPNLRTALLGVENGLRNSPGRPTLTRIRVKDVR
jgi:hypothetical protein